LRRLAEEVPYAPETQQSGVEYTDFIQACWYRRSLVLPLECARTSSLSPRSVRTF
jgi:beta-glucuronidase